MQDFVYVTLHTIAKKYEINSMTATFYQQCKEVDIYRLKERLEEYKEDAFSGLLSNRAFSLTHCYKVDKNVCEGDYHIHIESDGRITINQTKKHRVIQHAIERDF